MDITIRALVVASSITFTGYLYGMQEQDAESQGNALKVYVVPGLGGHREDEALKNERYSNMLFNVDDGKTDVTITYIVSPARYGLGQKKCTRYVKRAIEQDIAKDAKEGKQYDQRVLLAFSQGAATVANLMQEDGLKIPNLKIMLVEGLFLSANDALHDSIHGARSESYGFLKELPYLRYWLPLFAQMVKFPYYKPAGPQPIHALSAIPKDLPLVIIHGTRDQRVDHDENARVVYSWLRQQGKDNVYLISKEGSDEAIAQEKDHVTVLGQEDVPAVHAILRKHNILPAKQDDKQIDLAQFQPQFEHSELQRYIALYHAKIAQHTIHERIEQGIDAATILAGLAVIYWSVKSMLKSDSTLNETMPDKGFMLANSLAFIDQYLGR